MNAKASVEHLIRILCDALAKPDKRMALVATFQRVIWHDQVDTDQKWIKEIFRDLAYDLDYYQPDPSMRSEDPVFYGEERFQDEILSSLTKLKAGGLAIPYKIGND